MPDEPITRCPDLMRCKMYLTAERMADDLTEENTRLLHQIAELKVQLNEAGLLNGYQFGGKDEQ